MKISITYGWNSSEERAKNLPYTSMFPKTKFNENLGISLYKRNGYDKIDDIKFYKFDYEELSEMDMKKELSKMFEGKGIAEINIAKQRNGPIGTIDLVWLPEFTKFANLQK